MSVLPCMASVCPSLYTKKGQKLSGMIREDAADAINMYGPLHMCAFKCTQCVYEAHVAGLLTSKVVPFLFLSKKTAVPWIQTHTR